MSHFVEALQQEAAEAIERSLKRTRIAERRS